VLINEFSDWCQVSANYSSNKAAIRKNGTLWLWGAGCLGQLGTRSVTPAFFPTTPVGGFTDWCQVSVGCCHTAAIRSGGTLWTWGNNRCGKLGNNSTINTSSPVLIGSFLWCKVSAGRDFNLAIRNNGTLYSWGENDFGELGLNDIITRSTPILLTTTGRTWSDISVGEFFSSAVGNDGTLWTWGLNNCGQLGDDSTVNKSSPVSVIGGFTDWCQVSAGCQHTAAVRTNGTLWTWGSGNCGQLGDGTVDSKSSPVSVIGGFTDWCQVSGGCQYTAAVRTNGTLWTWGSGACGQLGDDSTIDKSSPISVVGGFTDWCQVSVGSAIRMLTTP